MNRARLLKAAEVLNAFEGHEPRARGAKAISPDGGNGLLSFGCDAVDGALGGGLAINMLHEMRCEPSRDAGVLSGFVLAMLARLQAISPGRVLWVSDPAASHDAGRLFPDGFALFGLDPRRLTFVMPRNLEGAIWAIDQAAKCPGLSAAVFQLKGHSRRFDLTASRRLMMRARESGVFVCIVRQASAEEASAAATRWLVRPHPSGKDDLLHNGIGQMRLALTLERNRNGQTGHWPLSWNPHENVFSHAAEPATDTLSRLSPPADRSDRKNEMGQVLAFGKAS